MRYELSAGIVFMFIIAFGLVLSFPLSTSHAQQGTSVPPTPTPIVILIEESVSVGETSGNEGLDPITEAMLIEDSTSTINPMTEAIAMGDSTSTINPMTEAIAMGDSTSTINPMTEAIAMGDSTSTINPIAEAIAIEDKVFVESDMVAASQRAATGEKVSQDAFSRGTGSIKENGEGSYNVSPGEAGNAGSTWMVVVYVVTGLVAVALFGLLGRRLLRRIQD